MTHAHTSTLLACLVALTACTKDDKQVAQDLGLVPDGCGTSGARLEATIGSVAFCADLQLLAVGDEGSVIVTGVDLVGNTLILQFDDLAVGAHAITEASNSVLYMQTGTSWTVAPGVEGTLTIIMHDPDARSLKATFSVPLSNEENGQTRQLEAGVEVTYSAGG